MDNYKIKRNSKPLSDEQINRHKDFDKLLGDHKKIHHFKDATKPLFKNIRFMTLMILISVVVLVLAIDHSEKAQDKTLQTKDSITVKRADTTKQDPRSRMPDTR